MSRYALAARFTAGTIDRTTGVIHGVSLATEGPALGYDLMVDHTTLEQLRDCAATYSGGLKVKLNHEGGAGDIIGFLTNLRIEGKKLLGDLNLFKSYEKRAYILELAEMIPDTFGLSVSFKGPREEKGGLSYARCVEIYSCDLVAEPAANIDGLFSAKDKGVDAGGNGNFPPMTADEIKTLVQAAVATALVEFSARAKAIEDKFSTFAPTTELAALRTQVTEFTTQLTAAKTELAAKIGDEKSRLELAAKAVATEFTRHIGTTRVGADAGGNGGTEAAPADRFDGVLTKHFAAEKSKVRAWQLAMHEDPKGYEAFKAAQRRPAFEKAAA